MITTAIIIVTTAANIIMITAANTFAMWKMYLENWKGIYNQSKDVSSVLVVVHFSFTISERFFPEFQ